MKMESVMSKDRDSIIIRERTVRDTVYITKEVYKESVKSNMESMQASKRDTVVVTEWREKIVELPPERYVSKYHRFTSVVFILIVVCGCVFVGVKLWLKFRG